jgi:hypothetical protein
MAENQNRFENFLTNLALITDGIQNLLPYSKSVIVYEINQTDFNFIRSNFKNIKYDETQIKIDISGTEVVFILENSIREKKEEVEIKPEVKETLKEKIIRKLSLKKGS